MATVLTLEPAFFSCMNSGWLRGTVTGGNTVIGVNYINWPDPWGFFANLGMNTLDGLILSHINDSGGLIVFGHSMGSQVACKWLREKGPTSTADPTKIQFILTGNPERRYGGTLGMLNHNTSVPQSPGWTGGVHSPPPNSAPVNVLPAHQPGVPASNRYRVIDFARQYDYFADYPSVASPNGLSTSNASQVIHCSYTRVALTDSDVAWYPSASTFENNVRYGWSPTHPLASVANMYWLTVAEKTARDAADRATVEAAYARPVTVP